METAKIIIIFAVFLHKIFLLIILKNKKIMDAAMLYFPLKETQKFIFFLSCSFVISNKNCIFANKDI